MRRQITSVALTAAALLLGASFAFAADGKNAAEQTANAASAAGTSQSASKARKSAPAAVKLVDINKASAKDLMKLAGIGEAEATRIVAGRPYASKAELVTRGVIDAGLYSGIKQSIVARQPYKSAVKNAEIYSKQK